MSLSENSQVNQNQNANIQPKKAGFGDMGMRMHMKNRILVLFLFFGSFSGAYMNSVFAAKAPNDLVRFLEGKWKNVSFEITDRKTILREEYLETMVVKDSDTLTITAHGYRDGKDLTKDMHLIVKGDVVVMKQREFRAEGKREGNVYSLSGTSGDKEFRFRLYTIGDKYVFHRETWSKGRLEQIDMSYLIRQ